MDFQYKRNFKLAVSIIVTISGIVLLGFFITLNILLDNSNKDRFFYQTATIFFIISTIIIFLGLTLVFDTLADIKGGAGGEVKFLGNKFPIRVSGASFIFLSLTVSFYLVVYHYDIMDLRKFKSITVLESENIKLKNQVRTMQQIMTGGKRIEFDALKFNVDCREHGGLTKWILQGENITNIGVDRLRVGTTEKVYKLVDDKYNWFVLSLELEETGLIKVDIKLNFSENMESFCNTMLNINDKHGMSGNQDDEKLNE